MRPHVAVLLIAVASMLLAPASRGQVCGNGQREAGEQCDDGNTRNGDGCSAQCKFEQNQRMIALKIQYTTDTVCTANAFGGAIVGTTAQNNIQGSFDSGVADGSVSVVLAMLGLDDLSGTTDSAVQVGIVNGTPVSGTATYSGTNDLDWWYVPASTDLDGSLLPLRQLSGSIASKLLTTTPGSAVLDLTFGGTPSIWSMSSLRITAASGMSSTPVTSSGGPPGHLASEHLDPALVSYATSGASISGEMCGNVTAQSLYNTPVSGSFTGTTCNNYYTTSNSVLDVFISGCKAFGFVNEINATQPDQSLDGVTYRFTANSSHQVTACTANGQAAALSTCLANAAYSSFFKFSTDRVIQKAACPSVATPVITAPPSAPAGAPGLTASTAAHAGSTYAWGITNGTITAGQGTPDITFTTGTSGTTTLTVTETTSADCPSAPGSASVAIVFGAPQNVVASATSGTSVTVTWTATVNAVSYEVTRQGGGTTIVVGTPSGASLNDTTAAPDTAYLYTVRAVDGSNAHSAYSAPDLATTVIFSDDPLSPGTTVVKAAHINELRTAVHAVQTLAGAALTNFTDSTLTVIKAVHVTELRTALDGARSTLALPALSYTDPTLTPGVTPVKAVQVEELRSGVK